MNEYYIYSAILATFGIGLLYYSYKFQKDFTNISKPNKLFVGYLTLLTFVMLTTFSLITFDVYNIRSLLLSKLKNSAEGGIITILLTIINSVAYIIVPLVFFYLNEYSVTSEITIKKPHQDDLDFLHPKNENDSEIHKIKEEEEDMNEEFSSLNFLKNYFYYLILFSLLNLLYFIYFKIFISSANRNLIRYSQVSDDMRKFSHFYSSFEILTYINFGILFVIAKILTLIYLPYGIAKLHSIMILSLKEREDITKEYNNLNNNKTRNYELIRNITNQKRLTGKPLTRKEKMILKACEDTKTVLDHKQDIMEENFSKVQIIMHYLSLPFKFIFIFFSLFFTLLVIISKCVILYSEYFRSLCGAECGYIPAKYDNGLTLQNILFFAFGKEGQSFVFSSIFITLILCFFISSTLVGMKHLGLFHIFNMKRFYYTTSEVRSDKILTFIFYTIFFCVGLQSISIVYNLVPDYSNFSNNHVNCDMVNFNSDRCVISNFGIFNMKLYLNFPIFKYFDLFFNFNIIILTAAMIISMPLQATFTFFKTELDTKKQFFHEALSVKN
jgi:hypothetical protein